MRTLYSNAYVLNILSDDHPGIIAAVSGVIVSLGGNIDACSQTVLGGYFTQILVVSLPESIDPSDLAGRIHTGGNGLQVVAKVFTPPTPVTEGPCERFVVTAFGTDKPGIIHRFSQYLAGKDVNVVDLYWDRPGETDFVLVAQVEIPAHWDTAMLQADLEELGKEMGFTVRLQHENIFVATNQLRLT